MAVRLPKLCRNPISAHTYPCQIHGGLQQQGPEVEVAGVKPAQWIRSDSDHQIAVGVAYGVNHGTDVVVADVILTSEYLYTVVIDEGGGVLDGFDRATTWQDGKLRAIDVGDSYRSGGVPSGAYSQPRLAAKVLSGFWTLLLLAPSGSTNSQ